MVNDVNFVSVPRCASNSIHKAIGYDFKDNHYSIRKTKDERWSFAVIRDPLERLISWWKYHNVISYDPTGEIYDRPFKDWVRAGCRHHWTDHDLNVAGIYNPLHQYEFVCDGTGTIMVNKLLKFDDVSANGGVDLSPKGVFVSIEQLNASTIAKTASINTSVIDYIHKTFESDYKLYNSL